MKKLFIPLSVLLIALMLGGVVYASDITGAGYKTKVQVSNDSAAAQTGKAACFELSTADMIIAGMLNATATDAVMLEGGTDTKFMPGWGA
ncbi:hypothetical protein M0R72_21630, partial [Candidatus Pacearchaeota archaeon]|nr:hypothetical protein [Candidatus Pacearchaeota archaeon]